MKHVSIVLLIVMVSMVSCAINKEKEMAEISGSTSFQPKPLDDEWSKWLVGEWEGTVGLGGVKSEAWREIELGLNGQFLITKHEHKITDEEIQGLKKVTHIVLAEQTVESSCPISAVSMQLPDENEYDTDLSITYLDISLKTDFQNNTVDTVVKASVKNFSDSTVDKAEFWFCPGINDADLSADIKHIYSLDNNERRGLKFSVRTPEYISSKGDEWEVYTVTFQRSIRPREKLDLVFEYTMRGKSDHSSAPIWQSEDRVKELFLRGDFYWCPTFYVEL